MKSIALRWLGTDSQKDVSIINVADLSPTREPRVVRYPVYIRNALYGIATCTVVADDTTAFLDYGAHPEANRDPEMILGVARLKLRREPNDLHVVSVAWKEPGCLEFVDAEFEIIRKRSPPSSRDLETAEKAAATRASALSDAALPSTIPAHPSPASRIMVATAAFIRNPYVVEATLRRAKGKCERCTAVPFISKATGKPYLEVHHMRRLADGGDDHPSNTIALCPNCHREMHFGI